MGSSAGRLRWLVAPLAGMALIVSCGRNETKDNIPVTNSGPGVVVTVPSFTPISSATPSPIPSPSRTPTATATPTRTPTPTATPTATPTPSPTPTPTPEAAATPTG